MTAEKASTLKLLREGIGNAVHLIETRAGGAMHEVTAHLPDHPAGNGIPVLFLISSLAFLEATPSPAFTDDGAILERGLGARLADDAEDDDTEAGPEGRYNEVDGWTPSDFLSHLRYDGRDLALVLGEVRGRAVFTEIRLTAEGNLVIKTLNRGQSANRWLTYVQGRTHLSPI
jgi:hypothetical protein